MVSCSRRVSSHKSVVFTGCVGGFDKLEQDEIREANFVTVKEVFAAEIGKNSDNLSGDLLNQLVTVTRAEHGRAHRVHEAIVENLLQHND